MTLNELISALLDIRVDLRARSPQVKLRNVRVTIGGENATAHAPTDTYIIYGEDDTIEIRIE